MKTFVLDLIMIHELIRGRAVKRQSVSSRPQKHENKRLEEPWGERHYPLHHKKQLDGIWVRRLVCQRVCLVERPVEGLSLTMRWMNADTNYDSAVTIKNTHALRFMLPKASIKETTRTLTFNCFISTILVHNKCASSSGADPGIFGTCQPRMWKSPSDPELFPGVVSTGKCFSRWPQVIQKTCTKRKDLNNRTHNERRQMWAHIDIHHESNSQINPLNGTCGQWAVEKHN